MPHPAIPELRVIAVGCIFALATSALPAAGAASCDADCRVRGSDPASACLVQLAGATGSAVTARRGGGCEACCTDGDPRCDEDGTADGACRFVVDLCVNVGGSSCVPGDVTSLRVANAAGDAYLTRLEEAARSVLPTGAQRCTAPVPITVKAGGRKALRTTAWALDAVGARRDRDRLVLRCRRTACGARRADAPSPVLGWSGVQGASGRSWSVWDALTIAGADARALQLRRRAGVVRVVGPGGEPKPGVRVEVEQVSRAFPFGTAVDFMQNVATNEQYLGTLGHLFNAIVTENSLKWAVMEPDEGVTDGRDARDWIAWAGPRGVSVKGTALVWGSNQGIPRWLAGRSPAEVRAALRRHVIDTTAAFRGLVGSWDVVNEPVLTPSFDSLLDDPGYVADAFRWAREGDPGATLVLNEYFPTDSRGALIGRVQAFKTLVRERLFRAGVVPDAIGFQGHTRPGPLPWIQEALDSLAELGLPIHVTEFDAHPLASEEEQADYYEGFLRVAFGHPAVAAIYLWGFDDRHHWKGGLVLPSPGIGAGIYDASFRPKPGAAAVASLLDDRWRTDGCGTTGLDGEFRFTGFHGRYLVRAGGRSAELDLGPDAPGDITLTLRGAGARSGVRVRAE